MADTAQSVNFSVMTHVPHRLSSFPWRERVRCKPWMYKRKGSLYFSWGEVDEIVSKMKCSQLAFIYKKVGVETENVRSFRRWLSMLTDLSNNDSHQKWHCVKFCVITIILLISYQQALGNFYHICRNFNDGWNFWITRIVPLHTTVTGIKKRAILTSSIRSWVLVRLSSCL